MSKENIHLKNVNYEEFLNRLSVSSKELMTHSPVAQAVFRSDKKPLGISTLALDKENIKPPFDSLELKERNLSSPSSSTQLDGSLESVNSVNIGLGSRSPGKFSLRGRNMKEYEEQLSHLKNENFSLKLRVYFLEERIGQKGLSEDKEDICRANMELKVETEALKKELYEKQELVRQASIVLSTLEEQYKEKMNRVETENFLQQEELQQRISQLEKLEPQIEVRVLEIIERDRIIEEKMEQLENQNKILVEIQITLDEQQKQNAELESNLNQIKQILQEKSDQLDVSCGTVKELAEKLMIVEKENNKLRKDLNRKEKKVQDLKSELKEAMEMLQKSNMESNMICRDDSVKEMAEDEHEGLWAELELRKKEVEKLRKEKQAALQEAEARMMELERRAAFAERLLINTHTKEELLSPDKVRLGGLDYNPEMMKQLQRKFLKGQDNINNLDLIKEILQGFNFDKNVKPEAFLKSKDSHGENDKPREDKGDCSSEKPQNPNSTLENALFAHMGQKVYNTSQTFNTYVLSGSNDDENYDGDGSGPQSCSPPELFDRQVAKVPDPSPNIPQGVTEINPSPQEAEMKKLCEEMAKIKCEAKALREDREIITEKLMNLQNVNKIASSHKSINAESTRSRIPLPRKSTNGIHKTKDVKKMQSTTPQPEGNKYHGIVEDLKDELNSTKKIITLQLFDLASKKYRNSVQKYKQEICSLRKRLTDSHNACDILRTRLEELVEFLEQIVDMDKKGIINLSSWTPQRRATLHKTLNESRALSHSLSQSLMIGMDTMLGDANEADGSVLNLALDRIPEAFDMTQLDSSIVNATLNNTVDVFDMSFDLSTADSATADMIYETIEAKINYGVDVKAVPIEGMANKCNQINNIIVSKDRDLKTKANEISELKAEVLLLRDEICAKDDILDEIKSEPKLETLDRACSPLQNRDEMKIQEEQIKQQELQLQEISNKKQNQEQLIAEQNVMIKELSENVLSYQTQLESTIQSKQNLEKELDRVDSKILCVTKENFSLLVDKTNLQSQLSSADAKVNFFKKDRERSVSQANSEHKYEKLLGHYKAYQTAVGDLEKQNERLSVENEAYKQKAEVLQDELKTICGRLATSERTFGSLATVQSSYDAVESKYCQLQSAYDKVISDKAMLEARLHSLEPKLLMEKSNLLEYRSKESLRHLDPMCLSPSNKENSILRARLAQHETTAELSSLESPMSVKSIEFLQPHQLDNYRNISTEHITSPKRSPNHQRNIDAQTLSSPNRRQLYPSISIASDVQFSDRNLTHVSSRLSANSIHGWQKGLECAYELCADPSHSQLAKVNEELQNYNWELEESLKNTKLSLKNTLGSVATAKEKQESVERAIFKQLNKTHNVLRKAKGNLRRSEKPEMGEN